MGNLTVGGFSVDTSQFTSPVDGSELDVRDRSSHVESVWTANVSLITLVSLFVGLRIFVRSNVMRKIFLDDVLILIASLFTLTLASVCLAVFVRMSGTLYLCHRVHQAGYHRVVLEIYPGFMYMTGVVILGLWISGIFVTIFQCHPVSGAWDFAVPERQCLDFIKFLYASSSVSVTTDIILCVLPWPSLWRLRLPTKQKIILCLLLGGGAEACIAGILRISKLHTLRSVDVTYQSVACLNLSVIECSVGINCVSIPPLRPLFVLIFPRTLSFDDNASEKSPLHTLASANRRPTVRIVAERQLEEGEDIIHQRSHGVDNLGAESANLEKAVNTFQGSNR